MLQSVSNLSEALLFGTSADRAPVGTLADKLSGLVTFLIRIPAAISCERLVTPILETHFASGLSALVVQARGKKADARADPR